MTGPRGSQLLPVLLLFAVACSSPLEPRDDVTLLVTNTTCDPGPCSSLRLLGFPRDQPNTPGGFWSIELGLLTGPTTCLTLPASREFTITEVPSGKTTIHRWTTGDGLALGSQPTAEPQLLAQPTTDEFVPASQAAWSVSIPGTGEAVPAAVCAR